MKQPDKLPPHPIHSATVKNAINGRFSGIKMSAALQQRVLDEIDRIDQEQIAALSPAVSVVRPATVSRKSKGLDVSHIAADVCHIKTAAPPVVPTPAEPKAPSASEIPRTDPNVLSITFDTPRAHADPEPFWLTVPAPGENKMPVYTATAPSKHRFRAKRVFAAFIAAIFIFCLSFTALGATVPAVNDIINRVSPEIAELLGRENLLGGWIDEIPPPVLLDDAVCVIDGIELRVTAIQNDGTNLIIFYSLRDTAGSRINQDSDFQLLSIGDHLLEGSYLRRYDPETGILSVAAVFADCLVQDEALGLLLRGTAETEEDIPLASDGEKLTLDFRQVITSVEYAAIPIEIDFNNLPSSGATVWLGSAEAGRWPAETVDGVWSELIRETLSTSGLEVLAPGDLALPIDGLDFAEISNIGFVGQQLHIQVHFFDYDLSLACGWESLLVGHIPENNALDPAGLNPYLLYRVTFPEDPEQGEGNYFEYVYDLSPDNLGGQKLCATGFWETNVISEDVWTTKATIDSHQSVCFEGSYGFEDSIINKITFTPYVIQLESDNRALHRAIDSIAVMLDDGTEIRLPWDEDSALTISRKKLPGGRYLITIPVLDLSGEQQMPDLQRILAVRINETLIDPNAGPTEPADPVDPIEPVDPLPSEPGSALAPGPVSSKSRSMR